jgi:hypothetical protein
MAARGGNFAARDALRCDRRGLLALVARCFSNAQIALTFENPSKSL